MSTSSIINNIGSGNGLSNAQKSALDKIKASAGADSQEYKMALAQTELQNANTMAQALSALLKGLGDTAQRIAGNI